MPKPTDDASWATDTNFDTPGEPYDGTPTKVAPSSGRKETGHEPTKRPPAQQLNWWQNLIGKWAEFLSPLFTSGGGFVAPVDEDVTVSGTGEFKHGDASAVWWPTPFVAGGWVPTASGNAIYLASAAGGANMAFVPLQGLVTGKRLKSIVFARFGDASASLTVEVYTQTSGGGASSLGQVGPITPAASWIDSTIDITDTVLTGDFSIALLFTSNAAGLRIGRIKPVYDHP